MRDMFTFLKTTHRSALLLGAVLISTGCSHTIKYKLTEQDRWTGPKTDRVLCVIPLSDRTSEIKDHLHGGGTTDWRVNFRERYVNKEIANGVTAMVVKHLDHAGLFKKVMVGTNGQGADLMLNGDIVNYSAAAKVNSTAEAVAAGTAGFGLIGAVIGSASTAGAKTEVKSKVELNNIRLADRNSTTVIWSGSVGFSTNFTAHWRHSEQAAVHARADESLKIAVSELVRRLGESIAKETSSITNASNGSGGGR